MEGFVTLLNKLSINDKYVDLSDKPLDSFEKVLTEVAQIAITRHPQHVGVFARDGYDWYTYSFQPDGYSTIMKGSLMEVKAWYAINYGMFKNSKVYGYMNLPSDPA